MNYFALEPSDFPLFLQKLFRQNYLFFAAIGAQPEAATWTDGYYWLVAFALVMSCTLDTLFVCCVRDKAEYKGAFMSDRLYAAFGFDKSDRREKRAAKKAAKAEAAAGSGDDAAKK